MFDAEYCARMKPLIKLELIFVGGFLLLPLLIAAAIYVSTAFGYCEAYSLTPIHLSLKDDTAELLIDDGVTAIINHKIGGDQAGFKVKSAENGSEFIVTTDRPLFPCSRFEGSLDLSRISSVRVRSAAILALNISDIAYGVMSLDTSQTISELTFINCSASSLTFTGTGALSFSGNSSAVAVSGSSFLRLDMALQGGNVVAQLTGGFKGELRDFEFAEIVTVSTGATQTLCVPLKDVAGRCVRTLNKYWGGDSGVIYYEEGVEAGRYTRGGIVENPAFSGRRENDVHIVCFSAAPSAEEDTAISLDNRGSALVYVFSGVEPETCARIH